MSTYLSNIDATIKRAKFECRVPESFEPTIPSYYIENNVPPIFTGGECDECISMLSIETIVNALTDNVPITIVKRNDALFIAGVLTAYIKEVERILDYAPMAKNDPTVNYFLSKAKTALNMLEEEYEAFKRFKDNISGTSTPTDIISLIDTINKPVKKTIR